MLNRSRLKKGFFAITISVFLVLSYTACAENKVLNFYGWVSEIPETVIRQFEDETGIKVNFSTYENNEIMYAKIRAAKHAGYDLIMPSSYFVDRMRDQQMLEKLDKSKLPNLKNLDPAFINPTYDPHINYSVPFIWGLTGIFYNDQFVSAQQTRRWADLWHDRFVGALLLLDDMREIFSMALLSLGFNANDQDPNHIHAAFLKLKALMKNVKVFSTDTVVSIIVDEDANLGMVWNGDAFKAAQENSHIKFTFPEEGFVIWVDNFAIPKNAPHKEAAYTFINFMLRPEIAKQVAIYTHFPIANLAGQKLLPNEVRNNPFIYPTSQVLAKGQFQTDLKDQTLALYEKYWEELKMGG